MKYLRFLLLLLFAGALFTSCEEEIEEVTYTGNVIHSDTRKPYANLEISVTDGDHINKVEHTNADGYFSIVVRFNEINNSYYLLIGDKSCVQVKREFKGFGQAVVDLGTIEVEGPQAPAVTTNSASSVTANSAISGGKVTDEGRDAVTARGVCWSKKEYPTLSDPHTTNGTGLGEFQSQLTNLETGQKYYVRAYATNKIGTTYGSQITFETTTGLPTITTDSVRQIRSASAVCYGNVTDNGGYKLTGKGVCWSSQSSTPTISDAHTTETYENGSFSSLMINLTANTKYYVRAYATNENGTSYGECVQFTSGNGLPIVETLDPGDNVTSSSILAVGNVVDDEGQAITERGFAYSTLPYPTIENGSSVTSGSGKGYFSQNITGITPTSKTYYIRAYATNANGTGYGDQVIISPERSEYLSLKTMPYGGYTYKIKPIGPMGWQEGMDACQNMVYGGYDDWFMPDVGEVKAILQAYGIWGVHSSKESSLYINNSRSIWTNDDSYSSGRASYYCISDYYGDYNWTYKTGSYGDDKKSIKEVIAVRKYRTEDK